MTNTQRGILILIKAALTGIPNNLPPYFDLEAAYKEIRRHQITPMAYAGAVLCGVPKDHPIMQQMFQLYLQQMIYSENQMSAVNKIFNAFDQHGIDYVPLKGSTLKSLYPKPEYRLMGDADILIRPEQYSKAALLLKELGFTFKEPAPNCYNWTSPSLYLELHTILFEYILRDYYNYYENNWHLFMPAAKVERQTLQPPSAPPAPKVNAQNSSSDPHKGTINTTEASEQSHRYIFRTAEDEFIYLFTHYAKHVRAGGIGCRHIIDLWIYRRAFPDMDENYIAKTLGKLSLLYFYNITLQLLEVWFGNSAQEPAAETVEFLSEFIFASGNWGNTKTHALGTALLEKQINGNSDYSQSQSLLRKAFPDINHMSARYPLLKKHPALLPALWPVRIVSAILFRRNNINNMWKSSQYATSEKVDEFQKILEAIGLKYDFK